MHTFTWGRYVIKPTKLLLGAIGCLIVGVFLVYIVRINLRPQKVGVFTYPSPELVASAFSDVDVILPKQATYLFLENQWGLKNGWKNLKFTCLPEWYRQFLHDNHLSEIPSQTSSECQYDQMTKHPAWDLATLQTCTRSGGVVTGKYGTDDRWLLQIFKKGQAYQEQRGLSEATVYVRMIEIYD